MYTGRVKIINLGWVDCGQILTKEEVVRFLESWKENERVVSCSFTRLSDGYTVTDDKPFKTFDELFYKIVITPPRYEL
jgi:hypothetical protein